MIIVTLRKGALFVSAAALFLVLSLSNITGHADEPFYQGKTLRFIVGSSPGGGYDTYTRLVAEHIGKYIPGSPNIIVENKPGAAGLLAARYLYERAEPDGLTIAMFDSNTALLQVLKGDELGLDTSRYRWVGAPVRGFPVCAVMGFTGTLTFDDIRASSEPIRVGGIGSASQEKSIALPLFLNQAIGQKFEIIRGYKGSSKVRLAMQQKEVDGICLSWESLRATGRPMLDADGEDKLIPFAIQGNFSDPEVQNIPQFTDILEDEQLRQMFETWSQPFNFQRPFALPPNTPDEPVAILRDAFQKALQDTELLATADRAKLLINPVTAEEIEQYVSTILSTPEPVLVQLRELLEIE